MIVQLSPYPPVEIISREAFLVALVDLLDRNVVDMDWQAKRDAVRHCLEDLDPSRQAARPQLTIIPPQMGHRPLEEALYPGFGCSDSIGLLLPPEEIVGETKGIWILYQLSGIGGLPRDQISVRLSASFVPATPGLGATCPISGLDDVVVQPRVVSSASYPVPRLDPRSFVAADGVRFVAAIDPTRDLLPAINDFPGLSADEADPFSFGHLFHRHLLVDLTLMVGDTPLSRDVIKVEVFDTRRFGSLYTRLIERLIRVDTAAQAKRIEVQDLPLSYHPWFPVLAIGLDKANLYMRAIYEDVALSRCNLPDPRWLVRVGLYLEFLTCLGIFEAVKDDYPDLLAPAERESLAHSPLFAEIRSALDAPGWKKVWALRPVAGRALDIFSDSTVSLANLMRKQKAVLAFLHMHHDDLKGALALAGPNVFHAQEAWHRVFRDAERAVLQNSLAVFPELNSLPESYREFAFWHQAGSIPRWGIRRLPSGLTSLFGDQDGIFPAACRQYRGSMNDVARWARARGLMDFTGDECIPKTASLLEAYMSGKPSHLAALQQSDGYGPTLELSQVLSVAQLTTLEEIETALRRVAIFQLLLTVELQALARRTRLCRYGHLERVVVQEQDGGSLFIVQSGNLEVLVRQSNGQDLPVDSLTGGAIFGEIALLTGAKRTATVRALDEVVLFEIDREALQPIIASRPDLIMELSRLMAQREVNVRDRSQQHEQKEKVNNLASRIRQFLLS